MKLIKNPKSERVFAVEISETEIIDLASLGYHKADYKNPTYVALLDLVDEMGINRSTYMQKRSIVV